MFATFELKLRVRMNFEDGWVGVSTQQIYDHLPLLLANATHEGSIDGSDTQFYLDAMDVADFMSDLRARADAEAEEAAACEPETA